MATELEFNSLENFSENGLLLRIAKDTQGKDLPLIFFLLINTPLNPLDQHEDLEELVGEVKRILEKTQ